MSKNTQTPYSVIDPSKYISGIATDNPRREGSKGYDNWKLVRRFNGKTVEDYVAAGGLITHLRWDVIHGNVKLVSGAPRSKRSAA